MGISGGNNTSNDASILSVDLTSHPPEPLVESTPRVSGFELFARASAMTLARSGWQKHAIRLYRATSVKTDAEEVLKGYELRLQAGEPR